ncbi:hypothetical protein ACFVT5_41155 [Streptomyces sp. NPDC058001]|uniref:hypothetical protein n=1 Tax=Streptomyces sp. NPDC058001 TaxID=3346300 RepID=UPI0036E899BE
MCMGICMEPSIYGMELEIAMEIEDGVPDCCHGPMEKQADEPCTICCAPDRTEGEGAGVHTLYRCSDCGTVVEVSGLGLVDDIREKSAA